MYFLIYTSTARPQLDEAELNRLVSRSEEFNASVGITGLLMRDGDALVQLIEGPQHAVRSLAGRIRVDRRHSEYTVLLEGPTAEVAFPHWSLQLASTDRLAQHSSKEDPIRVYLKAVHSRLSDHRHRRAIEHLLEFEDPTDPTA